VSVTPPVKSKKEKKPVSAPSQNRGGAAGGANLVPVKKGSTAPGAAVDVFETRDAASADKDSPPFESKLDISSDSERSEHEEGSEPPFDAPVVDDRHSRSDDDDDDDDGGDSSVDNDDDDQDIGVDVRARHAFLRSGLNQSTPLADKLSGRSAGDAIRSAPVLSRNDTSASVDTENRDRRGRQDRSAVSEGCDEAVVNALSGRRNAAERRRQKPLPTPPRDAPVSAPNEQVDTDSVNGPVSLADALDHAE
jgi:hypothetical protein